MYPYLFGQEALPMYGICLAVGLLAAMLLFKIICKKKNVDNDTYGFYSLLGIISIALGILGAMLFQSVYDLIDQAVHGEKVRFSFGGMTFMGGLVTGVVVFVAGTAIFAKGKVKRGFFTCASYAAPCIVLGHFFGRIG
ncbi:MAG: prolipoprotein diacylglyceryl transferase, partial [Clostridiales bacterium]|nr:prolipoprotein diacylglyceryl transferase [Clostridiales bacterium]